MSKFKFRSAKSEDSPEIVRLWRENHSDDFPLPDPRRSMLNTVVEKEGKIVAYGMANLHPEGVMLMDRNLSKREKVEVLRRLLDIGLSGGREGRFQRFYIFTSSPSYADILRKHFKAKNIDQEGLTIDLGGN